MMCVGNPADRHRIRPTFRQLVSRPDLYCARLAKEDGIERLIVATAAMGQGANYAKQYVFHFMSASGTAAKG
jgi:hypothetical protein